MKTIIKFAATALVAFALGLFAGCAGIDMSQIKLPEISAGAINYRRTDPAGGTQITATGIKDLGDRVTAERLSIVTTYPSFSVSIEVENYSRAKDAHAAAK